MITERLKNILQNNAADIGFGNKVDQSKRLLNHDGSFNIERKGKKFIERFSLFHWLTSISWTKFSIIILLFYLTINLCFAFVYYAIGVDTHLMGIISNSEMDNFKEAYFFSSQTITTVGYGRISPVGLISNSIASLEAFVGLLGFALVTGLLYGRFSKPTAKILYSDNVLISPYKDINALMFRIANGFSNQLIEIEVQLTFSYTVNDNEILRRNYLPLNLERSKINFFPVTWTIVHPIDEESPLENMSVEDLIKNDAEFFIIIKAFDDTFSQTVYSRNSYKYDELISGAKFVPNFESDYQGKTILHLDKLNDFVSCDLNHQNH